MNYGFPVEEIDYKNIDKEVLTTNNKDSPNEQAAGQSRGPNGLTYRNYKKTQQNCHLESLSYKCVKCSIVHIMLCKYLNNHCCCWYR